MYSLSTVMLPVGDLSPQNITERPYENILSGKIQVRQHNNAQTLPSEVHFSHGCSRKSENRALLRATGIGSKARSKAGLSDFRLHPLKNRPTVQHVYRVYYSHE